MPKCRKMERCTNGMKKIMKIFPTAVVALLTICLYRKTRREQEKGGKEGRHIPYGMYETLFKRPFDILITGLALVLFAPIMGVIALLVKIRLGSPVIFKQQRPGKNEKIFTLYKFRTMTDERDANGKLLPDEVRLTKFGKFLRSTSMDELPELFNILKGDMSIIGPRPLMVEYLPYYTEKEKRRHDVRPGLTGLAQVSGRNYMTWEDKFALDVDYVDRIKFSTDLWIFIKTIQVVFQHSDIETGSFIEHEGKVYRPLNVERQSKK